MEYMLILNNKKPAFWLLEYSPITSCSSAVHVTLSTHPYPPFAAATRFPNLALDQALVLRGNVPVEFTSAKTLLANYMSAKGRETESYVIDFLMRQSPVVLQNIVVLSPKRLCNLLRYGHSLSQLIVRYICQLRAVGFRDDKLFEIISVSQCDTAWNDRSWTGIRLNDPAVE